MQYIEFGSHELKTWYHSPYPEPFTKLQRLYVCDFTMKYFRKRVTALKHAAALPPDERHPPGEQIYLSPRPSAEWQLSTKEKPQITAAADPQVRRPFPFGRVQHVPTHLGILHVRAYATG